MTSGPIDLEVIGSADVNRVMAVVAARFAAIDPADDQAVGEFYEKLGTADEAIRRAVVEEVERLTLACDTDPNQQRAISREWRELRARSSVGRLTSIRVSSSLVRSLFEQRAVEVRCVLLTGEYGTGKSYAAKQIHQVRRRDQSFLEINCAAIPPSLLESELFGRESGAFARHGLLEAADGGTLFLNEIGAMPLELQAKLLQALESRAVKRIGGRSSRPMDMHIIASTHEDLLSKIVEGSFRRDTFAELNQLSLEMLPLRERGEEVIELAHLFISELSRSHGVSPPRLDEDAKEWMLQYRWPGNVAELRSQIERALLLQSPPILRRRDFERDMTSVEDSERDSREHDRESTRGIADLHSRGTGARRDAPAKSKD